ncbi:Flp pilus assembly protein CpaB [Azospirillum sp.]|uniref:Flp pilus assembly protein CpaB n=1 Tax=Azospirillum sp. TaxID=34012 RepID=UPI003D703D91
MSVRKIILLVLALGIAGVTVQLTRALVQPPAPAPVAAVQAPPAPQVLRVLVAASDLPAGTLVQPSQLRWRAWPEDDGVAGTYMVEGQRRIEEFTGAVVRNGLRAGEPVVEGRLVKPGDRGFLAAVLSPGSRAVTVAINGVTGIAGFIFPGDRVDLILTQAVREDGQERERRASETVLADVRVLALDQRVNDQKGEAKPAQLATLEVTPRQAEAVALAAEMGRLSLSLRSLGVPDAERLQMAAAEGLAVTATDAAPDAALGETTRPVHTITWDRDLSLAVSGLSGAPAAPLVPESSPSESPAGMVKVQVIRGSSSAEVTFSR